MQGAAIAMAVEAQHHHRVVDESCLSRRHQPRHIGKQTRLGHRPLGFANVEQAEPRLEGDAGNLPAFSDGLLVSRPVQEKVFQERVDRVTRRLVIGIIAQGIEFHALHEHAVHIKQVVIGFGHVAHHDDDHRERRFRLERPDNRYVLADFVRLVDDEAAFLGPGLEPLVQFELGDVLLGVITVRDELDGNGVVAGNVLGVREQLQRGVDDDHVVAQERRANIHELLQAAAFDANGVHGAFPIAKPVRHVEQRVEHDEDRLVVQHR